MTDVEILKLVASFRRLPVISRAQVRMLGLLALIETSESSHRVTAAMDTLRLHYEEWQAGLKPLE